jgi:hypothetical protein
MLRWYYDRNTDVTSLQEVILLLSHATCDVEATRKDGEKETGIKLRPMCVCVCVCVCVWVSLVQTGVSVDVVWCVC